MIQPGWLRRVRPSFIVPLKKKLVQLFFRKFTVEGSVFPRNGEKSPEKNHSQK